MGGLKAYRFGGGIDDRPVVVGAKCLLALDGDHQLEDFDALLAL